jgi:hypothetical protein
MRFCLVIPIQAQRDFADMPLPTPPLSRTPSPSAPTTIIHHPVRRFLVWLISLPHAFTTYLCLHSPSHIRKLNEEISFLQHETRELFQLLKFQNEIITRLRRTQHYLFDLLPTTPYATANVDVESDSQHTSLLKLVF